MSTSLNKTYLLFACVLSILILLSLNHSNMVHKITDIDDTYSPPPKVIPVFYNLYTGSEKKTRKAAIIVKDQFADLKPFHKVYIRSIGVPNPIPGTILLRHDETGSEMETLGMVWDYCQNNMDDKVVYLHSKGSYHPSLKNTRYRRLITPGALSTECANLPDTCNVCSTRMSPLPHPHPPGNMWLARCEYIRKLIDPREFESKMNTFKLPESVQKSPDFCIGRNRFAAEHWVHSHPSLKACDLSNDVRHVWTGKKIDLDIKYDLRAAPRFPLKAYTDPFTDKLDCGYSPLSNSALYKEARLVEYKALYGEDPPSDWYGWKTYDPDLYDVFDNTEDGGKDKHGLELKKEAKKDYRERLKYLQYICKKSAYYVLICITLFGISRFSILKCKGSKIEKILRRSFLFLVEHTTASKTVLKKMICTPLNSKFTSSFISISLVLMLGYHHSNMVHKITDIDDTYSPPPKVIPVFYNLYTGSKKETRKAAIIVKDQFADLKPFHKVYIRSIGVPNPIPGTILLRHDETGSEMETLGMVWDYCQNNMDDKVVYLHSKGSYHPSSENTLYRRLITPGALSTECANLPDTCNVCSTRMSPLPHPHPPGNMWLARCEYIRKLIDPREFESKMKNVTYPSDVQKSEDHCLGRNRFAAEHWVHSHPSLKACDLSNDRQYRWGYENIQTSIKYDLRAAPRFPLKFFTDNFNPTGDCGYVPVNNSTLYKEARLVEYKALYGEDPPSDWYGWKTYDPDLYDVFDDVGLDSEEEVKEDYRERLKYLQYICKKSAYYVLICIASSVLCKVVHNNIF